jgi:molybdopterin synthase sulfur carrier subunit
MLESGMPGIQAELLNKNKNISDSINIYVNGENIRYLEGIQTILSDKDQVSIIPAAAAG